MKRQRAALGDLCTLVKGSSPIAKTKPGSYPLVTTGEERKTADTFQFDVEAVCIPLISSTGHGHASLKRVQYQTGKFALANLLAAARAKDPLILSMKFLARYLTFTKDRLIVPLMTGSANMSISIDRLATVPIDFPSLTEQERITKLLDKADELRKLRSHADRRAAELIPALFQEMFGDPGTNPRNWKRRRFGDLLDRIDGGWSPICHDRPARSEEWGVLKLSSVTSGRYDDTENKALPENVEPRALLEVNPGDILFTRKNTYDLVAASAFVFQTRSKLMLSDLIFRFRFKADAEVDPLFLWGLLTCPSKRKQVQGLASGSAGSMPNISKGRLMTLLIEVPPLPLQRKFATRVTEIHALEAGQAASRRRGEDLYQSMLHRAFSGEL